MGAGTVLDEAFTALIALSVTVVLACRLSGRSEATHYWRANPPAREAGSVPEVERAKPPLTFSESERAGVLAVINFEQYADLSICQIWARELDEDR